MVAEEKQIGSLAASEDGFETVSTTCIIKESISMQFLIQKLDVHFQFFYLRIDSIPAAQFSSWLRTLSAFDNLYIFTAAAASYHSAATVIEKAGSC